MLHRFVCVPLALAVSSCGSCGSHASPDAGPAASASASSSASAAATSAALSLPIAADHDALGNVYVAGFVAARGVASLSRFDEHAHLVWASDALDGLAFSSDAHIDVVASAHGAVVVWRGLKDGKRTRVGRFIGDDGKAPGVAFAVGSSACAVGDSLLWIGGGGTKVTERPVPTGTEKPIAMIAEGRDPNLLCAETKRAFLVEDGEDDMTVRAIEDGKTLPKVTLMGPDDLGDDEQREHQDFTSGDTFGSLTLTEKGHLSLRTYATSPSARRAIDHVVGEDEDLMAVDATASHVVAILAHEATSRCDGDLGTDILALDIPIGDAKESLVDVAHGDCGRDLGPYWVAANGDTIDLAWAVRGPRTNGAARAPVEALAWSALGTTPPKSIPLAAEEIVFAGCVKGRCTFAALARPENTDGMVPGEARLITIP